MASIEDRWYVYATDRQGARITCATDRCQKGLRWRVHYRTPDHLQRSKSFANAWTRRGI